MKHVGNYLSITTLILLGAGSSSRFKTAVKKQWLYSGDTPLWLQVVQNFEKSADFQKIIVVSSKDEIDFMKNFATYDFVEGGQTRQASLANALKYVDSDYVMVSDIARSCVPADMIKRILNAKDKGSCIVPVLPVTDTLYMQGKPIDREKVKNLLKEKTFYSIFHLYINRFGSQKAHRDSFEWTAGLFQYSKI